MQVISRGHKHCLALGEELTEDEGSVADSDKAGSKKSIVQSMVNEITSNSIVGKPSCHWISL